MIRENLLCPFCKKDLTKEIISNSLDTNCGLISKYKKCPYCLNDFVECCHDGKSVLISKAENKKLDMIGIAEELIEYMLELKEEDRVEVMSKFDDKFCRHCGNIQGATGRSRCQCMNDE